MCPSVVRQRNVLEAIIVAPAVLAALWLTGIEGYRMVQPESSLFRREEALTSLAQAITVCCRVEDAYAFIRAGQDPNELLTIDNPDYTGGGSIMVSPLILAVAAGNGSVVQMLIDFGARPELPQNRLAGCLAQELGQAEMLTIIATYVGENTQMTCPERSSNDPRPLLRWAFDEAAAVR
jgi:hypothetical protein